VNASDPQNARNHPDVRLPEPVVMLAAMFGGRLPNGSVSPPVPTPDLAIRNLQFAIPLASRSPLLYLSHPMEVPG